MLVLASGGFGFSALQGDSTWGQVARWFNHVPWEGGVFWDMIQPAFMFMVGVAMPLLLRSVPRWAQPLGITFATCWDGQSVS